MRRCASDPGGKRRFLLRRKAGRGAGPENSGGDPGLLDAGGTSSTTPMWSMTWRPGASGKRTLPEALGAGDTVVIRSHGELKSVLDGLAARGVRCVNADLSQRGPHSGAGVPRRSRRDGRWSSSESRTIRRSWDLPAGAFIRWCSNGPEAVAE